MHDPLEGQQVGRYVILEKLGGGGVATVYKATDQVSGQTVALKLLPPNPDSATLDRFRREALLAGALRHPHIVRILQVGTVGDGTSAYIAMELVQGESLASLLARAGNLRPQESCLLLEPIARALAFAHKSGVVHRDVKPSNILLCPVSPEDGEGQSANGVSLESSEQTVVPMLSDFGIARFLDAPDLTHEGRTVGTPAFMAPEQCMGSREIDGRADIYSLGTVLYRCVVGRLPFNGSTTQILHAHVFEPVVIDEEMVHRLPPGIIEILRRTLAKAPEERFQDAEQLADALASVGESVEGGANSQAMDSTATATLVLAEVVGGKPFTTNAVQVLVSAPTHVSSASVTQSAEGTVPHKEKSQRAREPVWSKALWVLLFVAIIGVGGWWNVRSWLETQQQEPQMTMPRFVVRTTTPTVAESNTANVGVLTNTTSLTAPAGIQATPTLIPTVSPSPASPETPTSEQTQVPTALQTAAPAVELPTATAIVATVEAPVVNDIITPSEETAGACSTVVDEFFLPTVAGLSGEVQVDFSCPTESAEVGVGSWLTFAQGAMVAIDGQPFVYVYYADGSWEQVVSGVATPSPDVATPPFASPFAEIWASEGRNLRLGDALVAEAQRGEVVTQPFVGGLMLGNRNSGEVLLLARSKLGF